MSSTVVSKEMLVRAIVDSTAEAQYGASNILKNPDYLKVEERRTVVRLAYWLTEVASDAREENLPSLIYMDLSLPVLREAREKLESRLYAVAGNHWDFRYGHFVEKLFRGVEDTLLNIKSLRNFVESNKAES